MRFKKLNGNESGIILLTVLMVSVIMMILAIGIISSNVSQVTSGQRQIDRIKSEQLAQGSYVLNHARLLGGSAITPITEGMDGKTYTAGIVNSGAGIGATTTYTITVNY